jgi:hypothetical protein
LWRHHRAAEFKKFLARIDKAVPAGLEVHLVCVSAILQFPTCEGLTITDIPTSIT